MCPLVSESKLGQAGEGGELGEMAVAAQLGGREVKVQVLEGEPEIDFDLSVLMFTPALASTLISPNLSA